MDTLGEIMNNRYQIEYRLGNAPIILMGRLSLGDPPDRGAAEKTFFFNKESTGYRMGLGLGHCFRGGGNGRAK